MDLDLYQLCRLPGRHPDGVSDRHAFRNFALGKNLRIPAPSGLRPVLEIFGGGFPDFSASVEKNFGFCKNFVCIWGKMGYNKVYENLQISSKAEKGIPWQKKTPRKKL